MEQLNSSMDDWDNSDDTRSPGFPQSPVLHVLPRYGYSSVACDTRPFSAAKISPVLSQLMIRYEWMPRHAIADAKYVFRFHISVPFGNQTWHWRNHILEMMFLYWKLPFFHWGCLLAMFDFQSVEFYYTLRLEFSTILRMESIMANFGGDSSTEVVASIQACV